MQNTQNEYSSNCFRISYYYSYRVYIKPQGKVVGMMFGKHQIKDPSPNIRNWTELRENVKQSMLNSKYSLLHRNGV